MHDVEILTEAIAKVEPQLTHKEKRIAAYLQARPDAVLVQSNTDIARTLNISPMTLTRFYRKLGFENSADIRSQAMQSSFGPESYRIDQRFQTLDRGRDAEDQELCNAAIRAVFELRTTPLWEEVVQLFTKSDAISVTGFQTMHFLADGFYRRLSYMRNRVRMIDGIDGVYADLLPAENEDVTLIIIDTFRYGAHGPLLTSLARERGINVVVIADEFCDWATGLTPHILRFPAETRFVLGMPIAITTALTLLLQDVGAELGESASLRMKELSKAQEHFGLFLE